MKDFELNVKLDLLPSFDCEENIIKLIGCNTAKGGEYIIMT